MKSKLDTFYEVVMNGMISSEVKRANDADLPLFKRSWFRRYFIKLPIIVAIACIVILIGGSIWAYVSNYVN